MNALEKSNECASTLPNHPSPLRPLLPFPFGAQLQCSPPIARRLYRRVPVAPIVPKTLLVCICCHRRKARIVNAFVWPLVYLYLAVALAQYPSLALMIVVSLISRTYSHNLAALLSSGRWLSLLPSHAPVLLLLLLPKLHPPRYKLLLLPQ